MTRLDTLLLCGVVVAVGLASQSYFWPTVTVDSLRSKAKRTKDEQRVVENILLLYAQDANNGVVPAFSSKKLPPWWGRYSSGLVLQPDVEFTLNRRLENGTVSLVIQAKNPIIVTQR